MGKTKIYKSLVKIDKSHSYSGIRNKGVKISKIKKKAPSPKNTHDAPKTSNKKLQLPPTPIV